MARKKSLAAPEHYAQTEEQRAINEDANEQCRLLQLPPELRNRIYELLVPTGIAIRPMESWGIRKYLSDCRIFHTCRHLRREAWSFFCISNTFELCCVSGTLHYAGLINILDPQTLASVRRIEVVTDYSCTHRRLIMPFFGWVSVLVDRSQGTIERITTSWPNMPHMQCDGDYTGPRPSLDGRCKRVREEHLVRLTREVEMIGLNDQECELKRETMDELARRLGRKRMRMPKLGGVAGKVKVLLESGLFLSNVREPVLYGIAK